MQIPTPKNMSCTQYTYTYANMHIHTHLLLLTCHSGFSGHIFASQMDFLCITLQGARSVILYYIICDKYCSV